MYHCTKTEWSHFSPKTCFLMHFGEQCQKHAMWMFFVHKLSVWCVLYISRCTHTKWSYFSPKPCFSMHFSEQCLKHAIYVVFVHKQSVWCVNAEQCVFTRFAMFSAYIFTHTRNCHISVSKTSFFMMFSEQSQKNIICVVFVHNLSVWCVLCMYPCTLTKWSYFIPKTCFFMQFSEQCKKHAICVVFVHKLSVF